MTLFHNAFFYTMQGENDIAKALIVDDYGKIVEILYHDIVDFKGKIIDLQSSYVYPAFTDTHTHSFEGGVYSASADLKQAKSISDILHLLAETKPIGGLVFGYNCDENLLKERRFPSRKELDLAVPDKPCLVRRVDGHSAVVNTCAINKSRIADKDTEANGGVYRARINDQICHWFHRNIDEQGILAAFANAAAIAVSKGNTTVHTMVGDASEDPLYYELLDRNKGVYPVEYILYPQIFDVEKALSLKSRRIGGCILADGSFGSGTAALNQPYLRNPKNRGELYRTDDDWYTFANKAHNSGLAIAVHAIGDRAINQIVNVYSSVQQENPKNHYHQVIHSELITEDLIIETMAKHKIAAVMQPEFDRLWGGDNGFYSEVLGKDRASKCNRFKSLISAGVLVTGSSDWYITDIDPIRGIASAVSLHNKEERISPYQATELYTCNAAKLINEEQTKGRLASGFVADLVVVDSDIMTSSDISAIKVRKVFKRGVPVFDCLQVL